MHDLISAGDARFRLADEEHGEDDEKKEDDLPPP